MKITIDNREIEVNEGVTILDAAEKNDIYIPHLCSHPELTPYGGCRLCIVEVEGMRGYPTACTSKVKDGMKVTTTTDIILDMRREIMQLILSEHPSGCLVCREKEECAGTMESIRKVGVTTGCRWCPKDGECELQRVVVTLEIDDIKFPVYYHDFDVEKYDPFFDRDYNICIYCGRCVRICEEHRKSFVLGLNERGKNATVGPAFHNTHLEAECEFCGACVSVCPTGTLAEKSRKWSGVPSEYKESICPFCSMNCETQIALKKKRIIGTFPPGDPHQSGGELCVKGRFCLGETVNHPDRLLEPKFRFMEGYGIISWEDAEAQAAEKLKEVEGNRTAVYLSPGLTLEEAAAAGQFAREVINTTNITTSVLNENMARYLAAAQKSAPLEEVEESGAIVTVLLKGNYGYAPLTLAVKRAAERGVPLCKIGWTRDTVSRFSDLDIAPPAAKLKQFFRGLLNAVEKGKGGSKEVKELVKMINDAPSTIFVLGPQVADMTDGEDILASIEKIVELTGGKIFAPNPFGNLTGLLSLPGIKLSEDVNQLVADEKIDLLYIIGDTPFEKRPPVDFIIHQGVFPPPPALKTDLMLPFAGWGEISGTYADIHGKRKTFKAVADPPGMARLNRDIFGRIAAAMDKKDPAFTEKAIAKLVPANPSVKFPVKKSKGKKAKVVQPDAYSPHLLIQERTPHAVHNVSLSSVVAGMAELIPEGTLTMNPADASRMGFNDGDSVEVESQTNKKTYPLKLQDFISPGVLFLLTDARPHVFGTNPSPVHLRRAD
ncbi:MAG: molybdopterin-dependent oxidoreductase [bacterium]|nr:molybdopterin-dependent oxidoreductase [bacterium]